MSKSNDHATDDIIVKEGDKPFNFSFFDSEEKKYELDEILGKKNIAIYFYPKDFTPGCTIQAEEFTENYEKFKDNEIEIIGISPDSEESHLKFREKMKIPYMLASDKNNVISKRYGVYGLKKFMGKEYYGVNRSTFLVDKKGKIIKVFQKVKPAGHSKEVLGFYQSKG
jgi:thioredoxin-dependent peroxiredoxin